MNCPIPSSWEVPQVFRNRMGATLGRQRTMVDSGHVLLILHDVSDPESPGVRQAQLFWRTPDGRWKSTINRGTTAVLLREHQQKFTALAERLEAQVEQAKTAADYHAVLRQASPALRTSRHAHEALQEARDAIPADRDIISARDYAQDLERTFELLRGYAEDGLEFLSARNAEESSRNTERMNRSGHQLNMLIALFLPITALGSILGMNLHHGLETWNAPYTFWGVSAFCLFVGYWIRSRLPKLDRRSNESGDRH
jgi:hypothetical protein